MERFKVGEVVVLISTGTKFKELAGEECTIIQPYGTYRMANGSSMQGYGIAVLGDKKYKGYSLFAEQHTLRKKRPPADEWADRKVKELLAGMKTGRAVREPSHAQDR